MNRSQFPSQEISPTRWHNSSPKMSPILASLGSWRIVDSGVLSPMEQMRIDADALEGMTALSTIAPSLRFFQWSEPVISFGYLLHLPKVLSWAKENKIENIVKRPTGGGAVLHKTTDLNISLLWPRALKTFSDHPRASYEQIHSILRKSLNSLYDHSLTLFVKSQGACNESHLQENGRFSVCFDEPVCNDVMMGSQKKIGGALRITKQALLYQGTVDLPGNCDIEHVKHLIIEQFRGVLTPQMELASPL